MTSSAYITHTLDPLLDPVFAEKDEAYAKCFDAFAGDRFASDRSRDACRGYIRDLKRTNTHAVDWAGDKLVIAAKDNYLHLFDAQTGQEERTWSGEWMSMQVDPQDANIVAAVSWNGKFRIFDIRADKPVHDVELKKTSPNLKDFLSLAYSPDSRHIAVANRADQIFILDLKGTQELNTIRLGPSISMQQEVNQMVWGPGGDSLWVATGGTPGKINIFPAPSLAKESATSVAAHAYTTVAMAIDRKRTRIASGGSDCLAAIWDPVHLVCTRTCGFATQAITTMDFNHDGTLLAWGTGGPHNETGEKNVTIVGTDTGTLLWQEQTMTPVQQVRFHATRDVLAYTINNNQLPDERESRGRYSSRDLAIVHTMTLNAVN